MHIEVDTRSPTPHYEQIRSQVTAFVLTGSLRPGTRLPPIRQLAGHLGLSNGAVARAYKELEREGTVTTNGKKGTVVAARDTTHPSLGDDQERARVLANAATSYATTAHSLGYDLDRAQAALRHAMGAPTTARDVTSE
ncbi:GntR family transcriptional regulator [Cryobacterium sp. Y50]|uniref:GntR family transcriptional regulator n=1 Tax=Cryobacterium sp. Y50 TaxID=2048286 RepID=UPI000CE5380B|nr:GntR family transcriptional regulator [Cryobacterium sp. Y50]